MAFPPVTIAEWRALVDKELAGRTFDKALVHEALEGIRIAPLYTEAPPGSDAQRELSARGFRICMRHESATQLDALVSDVSDGADAIWIALEHAPEGMLARKELARTFVVFDVKDAQSATKIGLSTGADARFALSFDPIAQRALGHAQFANLNEDLAALGDLAQQFPSVPTAMISTLAYHDAGAEAADELALALSTAVCYLEALLDAGLSPDQAARQIALQTSVGRDTFVALCKLRALRICFRKLLFASGVANPQRTLVHAVCSSRTLTVRDPWVNMLRVTTQVFAAVLGGADLVTPNAFDQAFGTASAHGHRVARNTGLVLREESALGQVADPTGGSYYFESLTDALARDAWRRFRALQQEGGIVAAHQSGRLAARLEAAWRERLDRIAKRKLPILGVSEFAQLDERLPHPAPLGAAQAASDHALPAHRDAAAFEDLRTRIEAANPAAQALLITLGSFAESRPRVGFAAGFFSAGGMRSRERVTDESAAIACLCGTDEQYAIEAAARARSLKAAGCARVLVAGRPAALEKSLREAGVDGFIFVGCDVVATLSALLESLS